MTETEPAERSRRSSPSAAKPIFSLAGRRVFVAGHRGMVGSALCRRLVEEHCAEILTVPRRALDLRRQADVEDWFAKNRPDVVFLAAARVGGIQANASFPADFIYDNLAIAVNVVEAARRFKVRKLLFLGSSCIYPKVARQPIAEAELLSSALEPTNEPYALAKIAGLKLCAAYRRQWGCDFISAMPTNLYGPEDNFDLETSHVLPALISKIHAARLKNAPSVLLWGSGLPRREFLHVDDLAEACVFMMKHYSEDSHLNVGSGEDLTIVELAQLVAHAIGYKGEFRFDASKPDGTMRKLLDVGRLRALGWKPRIALQDGVRSTYRWYLEHVACGRRPGPQAKTQEFSPTGRSLRRKEMPAF
jgi:GDP-L-fucose synthase